MDKHIKCVSDFCGNRNSPGAWSDLWEREDGSRYVALGGWWRYYAPFAPDYIEDTDSRFAGFLEACESGDDFGFVAKNWTQEEYERANTE